MLKYKYSIRNMCIFVLIAAIVITASLITTSIPVVSAGMNFSLTAIQANPDTDTQINLSWQPVADAQYYILYRDNQQIKYMDINSSRDYLSYTDTGLKPDTTYSYVIKAESKSIRELATASATCSTSKMLRPSGLWFNYYNQTNSAITLHWTNNSKATTQSIIKRTDGTVVSTVWGSSSSGSFVDYSYNLNGTGYVIVSADNYGHTSEASLPYYINSSTTPNLPSIQGSMKDGTATIKWTANTLSIGYVMLERAKYTKGYWSSWQVVNSDVNYDDAQVTDTPEEGGAYRYRLFIYALEAQGYTNISPTLAKPAAPKNLNCSFSNTNNILLTWTNNSFNDCNMRIERKDPSEKDYHIIADVDKNSSLYNDTSAIKPNTTYYYRVSSYDSDENFAPSDVVTFTTDPPESPSYLRTVVAPGSNIYLTWDDNSSNEQYFKVERSVNYGDYNVIATLVSNSTSYSDSNISWDNTTIYSYRVRAYSPYGYSDSYTNVAPVSSSAKVDAPISLNTTVKSSEQINLSWSYTGNSLTSTIIERRTGGDANWTQIANIAAGVTEYSDTGLKPDTTYYYQVRAAGGAYLLSTPYPANYAGVSARTMIKKPFDLSGYASSESSMVLSWNSYNEANEYSIERKTGSGDYSVVAYGTYYNKTWIDTGLNPNTRYTYRIRAKNISGNTSEYSDEVTMITKFIEAPSELKASAISSSKIELGWKDNSKSEAGFEIWRKEGKYGEWKKLSSPRYASKYTDATAKDGIEYYYKVRAYSLLSDGTVYTSAFAKEVMVKTEMPSAPTDLKIKIISADKVELKWKGSDDKNILYKIERMNDTSTTWKEIASVPVGTFTYTDTGLEEYVNYLYRVKAVNTLNNSITPSDAVNTMTGAPEMPLNIVAKALSPYSIGIYWDDVSNTEVGYIVERKNPDGTYSQISKTDANATSYIDKDLIPGQQYFYNIKSFNESGNSDVGEVHASTYLPATFNDISSVGWAKNEIEYMISVNLMDGKTDTLFKPDEVMTRAEFVSLVVKALNLKKVPVGSFADVNSSYWAYNELMVAKNFSIISGDSKNNFYPDNTITREQMAAIAVKAMKAAGKPLPGYATSVLDKYTDSSSVSSDAVYSMASLEAEGILPDKGSTVLAPKGGLTRAEAAVIVYRLIFKLN